MRAAPLCLLLFLWSRPLAAANLNEVPPKCDPNREQCGGLVDCAPPDQRVVVPEDVVLVLGNTGSGKSTLTKLLAREDSDMNSVLVDNNFLINGDHIGESVTSVTKIPRLVSDKSTGTHYVDCPGFEDNRGACVELNTTYYMKDVTRQTRRVKVLLLTPHYAVTKGMDRSEFITMLMHAAKVLHGHVKLEQSVGLVVTKVDAYTAHRRKAPTLIADAEVKRNVASFLLDAVLPYLEGEVKPTNPEDAATLQRAMRLVKVFLQQEPLNFTHIGLFRVPDDEGLLSTVQIVEASRNELLQLVHKRLMYMPVQPGDFAFSVSDRTKLEALAQSRTIQTAINNKLITLSDDFLKNSTLNSYDPNNIESTYQRFLNSSTTIRAVANDLKTSSSVTDFCSRIARLDAVYHLQLLARGVDRDCQHLDVMQVVSEKPLLEGPAALRHWTAPLDKAGDELAARADWHSFLKLAYGRLMAMDQQSHRDRISLNNKDGALRAAAERLGLPVSAATVAVANLTDLGALVSRTRQDPELECVSGVLVARGESLLLSEVLAARRLTCPGALSIEVYALNTVFVNADERLAGVSLAIVAPRVEAVGSPTIDLSGEAGGFRFRVRPQPEVGQRGEDGLPGQPGKPGGNFLCVAQEIVGQLYVSVRGGAGGPGERGGAGGNGAQGGGNGGDGGHGGAGGLGGKEGSASVRQLRSDRRPPVDLTGGQGEMGPGGRGGLAGDHRPHTLRRRKRVAVMTAVAIVTGFTSLVGGGIYLLNRESPTPPPPVYRDGKPGLDGAADWGRQLPDDPLPAPWVDVPARAAVYLTLNQRHPYRWREIQDFKNDLANVPWF